MTFPGARFMPPPQQRDRQRCKTAIDLVDRVDQLGQLDCAVMRRDIAIRVTEKDLARLFTDPSRAWYAPECMLEIVHTHVLESPRRWPAELLLVALCCSCTHCSGGSRSNDTMSGT
jgi:hypothetical protein